MADIYPIEGTERPLYKSLKKVNFKDKRVEDEYALLNPILRQATENSELPITVTSGTRSPEYNAAVGGVPNSYHKTGNALDVRNDPAVRKYYSDNGFKVINEGDHAHVQAGENKPVPIEDEPLAPIDGTEEEIPGFGQPTNRNGGIGDTAWTGLRKFTKSATAGISEPLAAAGSAAIEGLFPNEAQKQLNQGKGFKSLYREIRDQQRQSLAEQEAANPIASAVGDIAGMIAPGTAFSRLSEGAGKLLPKAAQGITKANWGKELLKAAARGGGTVAAYEGIHPDQDINPADLALGATFEPGVMLAGKGIRSGKDAVTNWLKNREIPEDLFGKATSLYKNKDFKQIMLEDPAKAKNMVQGYLRDLGGGKELPIKAQNSLDEANAALTTAEAEAPAIARSQLDSILDENLSRVVSKERLFPDEVPIARAEALDRLNAITKQPGVGNQKFYTGKTPATPKAELPPDEALKKIYSQNKKQAMQVLKLPELNESNLKNARAYQKSIGLKPDTSLDIGGTTKPSTFPSFKKWKSIYAKDLERPLPQEISFTDDVIPMSLISGGKRDLAGRVSKAYTGSAPPLANATKAGYEAAADALRAAENYATQDTLSVLNERQNAARILNDALSAKLMANKSGSGPVSRIAGPIVASTVGHNSLGASGALASTAIEEGGNFALGPWFNKKMMDKNTALASRLFNSGPSEPSKIDVNQLFKYLLAIKQSLAGPYRHDDENR